ncbi:MAG: fibrobacter succinogenes major paralogous domain-containing protein [Bacteroidetes bacterium]|nr:fibrobacter succinogenes major paralogous domain-containing protein [Bacteroidota bacterium]
MKTVLTIVIFGLSFLKLSGQSITNVAAIQEGNNAVITYNLQCESNADITIYYSEDNGATFKGPIKKVTGDVGCNITSGNEKRIIWNVLTERDLLSSDNIVFRVKGFQKYGKLIDKRDGRIYKTVTINSQVWMAENLNFKTISGSWCYDNNSSNCDTFGRLYDWNAALLVCPASWHLPSDDDWAVLVEFLGGNREAGGKMKETGTSHWKAPNEGASNSSGFIAIPGGYRDRYNGFSPDYATFWSSSGNDKSSAWYYFILNYDPALFREYNSSYNGFSIRCIRD